jgi:hypothetical protein
MTPIEQLYFCFVLFAVFVSFVFSSAAPKERAKPAAFAFQSPTVDEGGRATSRGRIFRGDEPRGFGTKPVGYTQS